MLVDIITDESSKCGLSSESTCGASNLCASLCSRTLVNEEKANSKDTFLFHELQELKGEEKGKTKT